MYIGWRENQNIQNPEVQSAGYRSFKSTEKYRKHEEERKRKEEEERKRAIERVKTDELVNLVLEKKMSLIKKPWQQKAKQVVGGAVKKVGEFAQKYPTPASYAKEYFKPTEQVRTRDVVREIPRATGEMAKTILQAPARGMASAVSSFAEPLVGRELATIKPGKYSKYLFGKEPIKPITQRAEEWKETAKEAGLGKGLQTGAMFLPIAGTALDLWIGGGGTKGAVNSIVKANTDDAARLVIQKLGKEYSEDLAKKIINIKTAKEASGFLDDLAKGAKTAVSKTSPLIQEARKYGRKEFEKAFAPTQRQFTLSKRKGSYFKTPRAKYDTQTGKITITKGQTADEIKDILGHESRHSIELPLVKWLGTKSDNYLDEITKKSSRLIGPLSDYSEEALFKSHSTSELSNNLLSKFTYDNKTFKKELPEIYDEITRIMGLRKSARNLTASQLTDLWNKSQPLQEEMVSVYHASPNMPTKGNWRKGTMFADTEQNARYYAESHHRGNINVQKVEIPKRLVEKNKSNNIYNLKEEYPVSPLQEGVRGIPNNVKPINKYDRQLLVDAYEKDRVSYNYETDCITATGGSKFVDSQLEKAVKLSKNSKFVKDLAQQEVLTPLDIKDTEFFINKDYFIARHSAIERFYKLDTTTAREFGDLPESFFTKENLPLQEGGVKAIKPTETAVSKTILAKKAKPTEAGLGKIAPSLKQPTEEVSTQISKAPQEFQKDISYLDSITKNKNVNPFINTNNLKISSSSKKFIDKTIEDIKPQLEESLGKRLSNQEVVDFADKTSKTLNRTIGREQTKEFEAALLNTRRKLAAMAENETVDREYLETLKTVKTLGTDIARKLQSLSVEAEATNLPKQKILEAVLKVNDNVDDILKAAEGIDFTNANQAVNFYRQFVKPTTGEWIDLVRYNSMLSSPTTHIINTFSNAVNTSIIAPIEKTLTGTIDFIGGIFGKKRTAFAGEGASYLKGYVKNLGEATSAFSEVMSGKRAITHLDLRFVPPAGKGIKGAITKFLSIPTRFLEAEDQFFRALAESGETAALTLRKGKGVSVPLLEQQAKDKAMYRLFRQELFDKNQGHLLDAVDQFTSKIMAMRNNKNPIVSTIAKFTVPFVKTPMNIFKQGLEYSPAGFATALGSAKKMEQISKAIIGSSVFAGAATMLSSGRLTWGEPTSEKQRQEWRQAGMQPYSVKIGDKWYSYQKLAPGVAFPLAIVAAINDAQKRRKLDDTTTELVLSSVAKYGEFLADQSYVKSIGDLLSAAKGGEAGIARVVSNYPQQLIPLRAFGGWLARLTDATQRKIDNKADFIDKQVQLLMTNIPGLSKKVPARLGTEGQEIPSRNKLINALSPVRVSTETEKYKTILDKSEAKRQEESIHRQKLEKAKEEVMKTGNYQKVDDTFVYKEDNELKTTTSEDIVRLKPTYNQVQTLIREGKKNEARTIVNKLSDEDYKAYKKVKASENTKITNEFKDKLESDPKEAVRYLRSLSKEHQDRILENMSDEEYKIYQSGK